VDEDDLELLEVVASPTRRRILALLAKAVDHPEELAKRLKLRRQGIDKQLMHLYEWGLVDRSAILPVGGRPRIVYRISERGRHFLSRAQALVIEYRATVRSDHQASLSALEDKLAAGDLDESAYTKRRQELERRYSRLLAGNEGK
jgi:predicted ArsR family transcriptional regulator